MSGDLEQRWDCVILLVVGRSKHLRILTSRFHLGAGITLRRVRDIDTLEH